MTTTPTRTLAALLLPLFALGCDPGRSASGSGGSGSGAGSGGAASGSGGAASGSGGAPISGSGGSGPGGSTSVEEARSTAARIANPTVPTEDAAALAAGNLQLAVDMHARLRAANSGNFIFSQTSISTALAMLYAGAANDTASQMASTLHFTLPQERLHPAFNALGLALTAPPANGDAAAFRIKLANATWAQRDFTLLPAYLDTLALNYGAGMFIDDFRSDAEGARGRINSWVSDQTEKHIPELFPMGTIKPSTVLVLANAVFFHGDWKVPFSAPSPMGTFHAPTGDVSVPMMRGDHNGRLWTGAGWSAAALPYVGGTTSMVVLLPDAGAFDTFERGLTAAGLAAMLAPETTNTADVVLPRFKFTTATALGETLVAMGMKDAFSPGAADFSGIDGRRDLVVQAVVHQATIAVDEKGTTAAAATGVSVGVTSVPLTIRIDRPFLFFIRHEPTGAILFQGRVLDPSK